MTLLAVQIALVATVYAVVLTGEGMLFGNGYQRLQDWTQDKYKLYPDEVWWLKPLISCVKCVAGQWCFWGYLFLFYSNYNIFEHIYFTAAGIFAAAIFRKIYTWTQY